MRIITILLYAVTVIACLWILIRLAARGICETVCDPGHSPWEYGQWVIAPKWPLLLACTAYILVILTPNSAVLAIFGWGSASMFWFIIWTKALREFRPLSKEDDSDYGDEGGWFTT